MARSNDRKTGTVRPDHNGTARRDVRVTLLAGAGDPVPATAGPDAALAADAAPTSPGRFAGPGERGRPADGPGPGPEDGIDPEESLFGLHAPADLILPAPDRRHTLRRFARVGVWAVIAAAGVLLVSGLWGWPQADAAPTTLSSGSWLLITALGLAVALLGLVSLAVLLAGTRGRGLAALGLVAAVLGTVMVMPVAGLVALARPAATRLGPAADAAFAQDVLGSTAGRWLGVGGLVVLGLGWLGLGAAVIASRVLNGLDGALVLGAVGLAAVALLLSWRFPLVISAIGVLAAGLGLGWTASRLTVEDHPM